MQFLEQAVPILAIIFIVIFCSILLLRLILSFIISETSRHYEKLKDKTSNYRKKRFIKEEEELMKIKSQLPKANSLLDAEARSRKNQAADGSYEIIPSEEREQELEEVKIVDVVRPIGRWTAMILGQKLTYLINEANIMNKNSKKGFWVSMIEAQERSAGRQRGRSL